MTQRRNPDFKSHLRRSAFYVILLALTVCVIPLTLAQRNGAKPKRGQAQPCNQKTDKRGHSLPANIIMVTNINDSGPGSLRDALAAANDGDTIDATGVAGTILLTSGELQINHDVTINGPGAVNLEVNGNATSRVLENFASNVTISGFTITNGNSFFNQGDGGGILNHGGLAVNDSIISSNTASSGSIQHSGGGICSSGGMLTVTNSVIGNNGAGTGGGIYADGAIVTISSSTINGNLAHNQPNGIATNTAQLTVPNRTISPNESTDAFGDGFVGASGGGIYNTGGTLTVTNSTISGNFVNSLIGIGEGGGVCNSGGMLTVTNTTFSGNSVSPAPAQGGAIFNAAEATIGDTVLNAGAFGGTIANAGTFTSLGYNLASDDAGGVLTGPGDEINTDPVLGSLQDNGGPTFTHALLPGSPAIDTGDPAFTPPPSFDQRGPGFDRVVNGFIDKGSFEVQNGGTPSPTPTVTPTPRPTPAPRPRPTAAPRP